MYAEKPNVRNPKQVSADLIKEKLPAKRLNSPEQIDDKILNESIDEDKMKEFLDGRYELNHLMKGALEQEMKQVMAKVRKELENPISAADKIVVNIFKKNAGDTFKNVLATNVAQRLLNVPKSFYVRIQLGSRPPVNWLKNFIEKYNVASLKYLENAKKAVIVKVNSFKDFDRVCATNGRNIVGVKITAVPIHHFARFPMNMNPPTSDSSAESIDKLPAEETEDKNDDNKAVDAKKVATKSNDNSSKVAEAKKVFTEVKKCDASVKIVQSSEKIVNVKKSYDEDESSSANVKILKEKVVGNTPKVTNNKIKSNVTNNKVAIKATKKDVPLVVDDEIDDNIDFLSIMDGGIVLDECSGSDNE